MNLLLTQSCIGVSGKTSDFIDMDCYIFIRLLSSCGGVSNIQLFEIVCVLLFEKNMKYDLVLNS